MLRFFWWGKKPLTVLFLDFVFGTYSSSIALQVRGQHWIIYSRLPVDASHHFLLISHLQTEEGHRDSAVLIPSIILLLTC